MKQLIWCLLCVFLLARCQATNSTISSKQAISIRNYFHPAIIHLQAYTLQFKAENGVWPSDKEAYLNIYGDSIATVFEDFYGLEFSKYDDSLIINYTLGVSADSSKNKLTGKIVEFEEAKDSANSLIQGHVSLKNNMNRFKKDEGKIKFIKVDSITDSIYHDLEGGQAKFKIVIPKDSLIKK